MTRQRILDLISFGSINKTNIKLSIKIVKDSVFIPNEEVVENKQITYSNIIIDDALYHVGASLKDLGKKCFGINKIEDKEYLNKILCSIN